MTSDRRPLGISGGMVRLMADNDELERMVNWRETEGVSIHPGFAVLTEYNSQRAEWRKTTKSKLGELQEAIHATGHGCDIEETANISWGELIQYMDEAKTSYANKAKDSIFRGWAREGHAAATILERLTSLIPEDQGISILRGTLAYIFKTWQARIANKNRILQELDDIPGVLASVCQICEVYNDDIDLKSLVWDFYGTLVDCLPELVRILNRTSKDKSVIKRLVKQLPEVEAIKVDEISERISTAKLRVYEATSHLDRNTWQETKVAAKKGYLAVEATRQTAHDTNANVRELRREVSQGSLDVSSRLDALQSEISQWRMDREQFAAGLNRLQAVLPQTVGEQLQNALYQLVTDGQLKRLLLQNQPETLLLFAQSKQDYSLVSGRIAAQPTVTEEDLVDMLQARDPTEDAARILRQQSRIDPDALGYAERLQQRPEFQIWLLSESPGLLLVDGACRDQGVGRTSPMSIFTASMASSLLRAKAGVVLQFFCAHHTDPNAPDSGPKGLVKSITSQLLMYPQFQGLSNTDFADQSLLDAVAGNNLDALCYLFENIFQQVDPGTLIYVLIDSIPSFESDLHGHGERMESVLAMFRLLINGVLNGSTPGPRLKLFMTSPNRSLRLFRHVDRQTEHVRLDGQIAHGHSTRRGGGGRLVDLGSRRSRDW